MSYAIIRNEKYEKSNLNGIYRHNERKNTSYTNKNIDHSKTHFNYSIKSCETTYTKKFDEIKEENNLEGWIRKNSKVACEYIITSDSEFFKSIGEKETRRYFQTAYDFVKNYKHLGEKYIISATVHLDESTPHMHLVFIPVIHKYDKKSGKTIDKICCSEFWKGKDSYRQLQDNFYEYVKKAGFDLERGIGVGHTHIPTEKYKEIINYDVQEMFKETKHLEEEIESNDIEVIKKEYKRIIKKFNTLAKRYTRIKHLVDEINEKASNLQEEYNNLKKENSRLENYIQKTFEVVHQLFDFPKDILKITIDNFVKHFEK